MPSARLLLASLLLALAQYAAAEPPLFTVNTGFTPPVSIIFDGIMREATRRLGVPIDFREVSAERSLMLVNQGIDDAECCRIPKVVEPQYPNLIAVPESVFEVRFSAFAANRAITIENWDSLKPYTVGTVTGWKILVKNIERTQPQDYFVLDNAEAMFKMLDSGRLDIATLGYLSGSRVLQELGLQDKIIALDPPLATRKLYLMLNRRHAALAPKFNRILAEMKADGSVDAIVKRVTKDPP